MVCITSRFLESMGNVRTKLTGALKRKAFEYLKWHPKKYRECVRDLNLQFVVDPRTLRRLFKENSRSKWTSKQADINQQGDETVMEDENGSLPSGGRGIREMIQIRRTLRAVMEFLGSTKITAFSGEPLDWKKVYPLEFKTRQAMKKQWGRICPVVSRYCAGVSLDVSESEIPILEHLRDTVDGLDEVDIRAVNSLFPFETSESLTDLLDKTKKRMKKLTEREDFDNDCDFKSKMTAIITGWPKSSTTKQRSRINIIVREYDQVSRELEAKWAEKQSS